MAVKDYHEDSKRKVDLQKPKVFPKLSEGDYGNCIKEDQNSCPVKVHSVGGTDVYPIRHI